MVHEGTHASSIIICTHIIWWSHLHAQTRVGLARTAICKLLVWNVVRLMWRQSRTRAHIHSTWQSAMPWIMCDYYCGRGACENGPANVPYFRDVTSAARGCLWHWQQKSVIVVHQTIATATHATHRWHRFGGAREARELRCTLKDVNGRHSMCSHLLPARIYLLCTA